MDYIVTKKMQLGRILFLGIIVSHQLKVQNSSASLEYFWWEINQLHKILNYFPALILYDVLKAFKTEM